MKKIILTSISFWFIYSRLFFWPSLLNLPFWNNACADRGLSKIMNMRQKDNLCILRNMNINKTRSKRECWVSRRTPYNFLWMKMYNRSENLYYNCLRRFLHKIKQWKSQEIELQQWKQSNESKIITRN